MTNKYHSGYLPCYPPQTLHVFGPKNATTIYGWFFSTSVSMRSLKNLCWPTKVVFADCHQHCTYSLHSIGFWISWLWMDIYHHGFHSNIWVSSDFLLPWADIIWRFQGKVWEETRRDWLNVRAVCAWLCIRMMTTNKACSFHVVDSLLVAAFNLMTLSSRTCRGDSG